MTAKNTLLITLLALLVGCSNYTVRSSYDRPAKLLADERGQILVLFNNEVSEQDLIGIRQLIVANSSNAGNIHFVFGDRVQVRPNTTLEIESLHIKYHSPFEESPDQIQVSDEKSESGVKMIDDENSYNISMFYEGDLRFKGTNLKSEAHHLVGDVLTRNTLPRKRSSKSLTPIFELIFTGEISNPRDEAKAMFRDELATKTRQEVYEKASKIILASFRPTKIDFAMELNPTTDVDLQVVRLMQQDLYAQALELISTDIDKGPRGQLYAYRAFCKEALGQYENTCEDYESAYNYLKLPELKNSRTECERRKSERTAPTVSPSNSSK